MSARPGGASPGVRLRSAREARRLSIEEVADRLRLNVALVLAMEEDRLGLLGAPVFARGHLKNYAALVGAPEREIMDACDVGDVPEPTFLPALDRTPIAQAPHAPRINSDPLTVLAVAVAASFAWWIARSSPVERKLQAIRGMNDLLADQLPFWQRVEAATRGLFADYGYREMRVPLLEHAELFHRMDRRAHRHRRKGNVQLRGPRRRPADLRPEATAGLVRAAIEHGLLHNQKQRLWTAGAMFRHEQPQRDVTASFTRSIARLSAIRNRTSTPK